ncbi:MAG TPA: hypothetical protein VJ870_02565 [Amycolatopsis sp.]|nr:hypothetical protein [Amycolatopsis sp.]
MTTNTVSAGTGSDARTFLAAVLLTYGTGVLMLDGYILLSGVFGAILGLVGGGLCVLWWRHKHDKVFPRDLPTRSIVILAVVDVVLTVLAVLLMS